ncbi:MAG: NADH-quinone oxidoreductase subunit NuoE [Actinobacteria bacterium]|nr:NADH-quinone oxidoreductase subunit NuoE [Actinomycetota bacterium]
MTQTQNGSSRRVLSDELRSTAEEIVAKYPNKRSATIPLLFLVQSQEGYVTEDGMREVGEIVGITPAQVLATASFYTMLKKRPQGEYLISVCRNISCTHLGARKVIQRLEDHLGIAAGGTTEDGKLSLEAAECLATCDGAPSMQVNYEDFYKVSPEEAVEIADKLTGGDEVRSVAGERVKTAREISYETATAGLRSPGSAGDQTGPVIGGETGAAVVTEGFRPKVTGVEQIDDATAEEDIAATGEDTSVSGEGDAPGERDA